MMFTYTYDADAIVPPTISNLQLRSSVTTSPNTTNDPTVEGTVIAEGSVSGIVVNLTFTRGGTIVLEDSATTDDAGHFLYTPADLAPGEYSVQAAAEKVDSYSGTTSVSDNATYTFHLNANALLSIGQIHLQNEIGTSATDLQTYDPTVVGTAYVGSLDHSPAIQVDTNNDGVVDACVSVDGDNQFSYSSNTISIPAGQASVQANWQFRVMVDNGNGRMAYGPWTPFTFTLVQDNSLKFSTPLHLRHDTIGSGVTTIPTIEGDVSRAGPRTKEGIFIAIYRASGTVADAVVTTDEDGHFVYTPTGLTCGTAVEFYAAILDPSVKPNNAISPTVPVTLQQRTTWAAFDSSTTVTRGPFTGDTSSYAGTTLAISGRFSRRTVPQEVLVHYYLYDGAHTASNCYAEGIATCDSQGHFCFAPSGIKFNATTSVKLQPRNGITQRAASTMATSGPPTQTRTRNTMVASRFSPQPAFPLPGIRLPRSIQLRQLSPVRSGLTRARFMVPFDELEPVSVEYEVSTTNDFTGISMGSVDVTPLANQAVDGAPSSVEVASFAVTPEGLTDGQHYNVRVRPILAVHGQISYYIYGDWAEYGSFMVSGFTYDARSPVVDSFSFEKRFDCRYRRNRGWKGSSSTIGNDQGQHRRLRYRQRHR